MNAYRDNRTARGILAVQRWEAVNECKRRGTPMATTGNHAQAEVGRRSRVGNENGDPVESSVRSPQPGNLFVDWSGALKAPRERPALEDWQPIWAVTLSRERPAAAWDTCPGVLGRAGGDLPRRDRYRRVRSPHNQPPESAGRRPNDEESGGTNERCAEGDSRVR